MLTIDQYDALTDAESALRQLHALLGLFFNAYATGTDAHLAAIKIEADYDDYILNSCTVTDLSSAACAAMTAALAALPPHRPEPDNGA